MSGDGRTVCQVEICRNPHSTAKNVDVKKYVSEYLRSLNVGCGEICLTEFTDTFLKQHVRRINIYVPGATSSQQENHKLTAASVHVQYHVFQLHEDGPGQEEITDEDMAAANHWLMPSSDFDGVWESLVFDDDIKAKLLSYAATTLLFSDKKVDANIISWNKVVLLHGPPGTGKTSLCKALAQKLSIRLSERFSYGQLIEINSHSLFSKWFSESGKLVMKMFQKIQELIDDPDALVCVLIDEPALSNQLSSILTTNHGIKGQYNAHKQSVVKKMVALTKSKTSAYMDCRVFSHAFKVESLTAARKSAMSGSEPSDSIRVVNAVLTQLDQIKRYPNVLILTTSNVTGAIDLAFVDRADIKQYIGPPSTAAIFSIYKSCVQELMKVGIITPAQSVLDLRTLELMRFEENDVTEPSLQLRKIAEKSQGLSGRALRKIPFIAQAVHIQRPEMTLAEFLVALEITVQEQFQEQKELCKD